MIMRIVAATALALSLAGAASAQTGAGGDKDNGQTGIPQSWTGEIGKAFFKDGSGAALLPKEEALQNFANLPMSDQEQVRSDCSNRSANSGTGSIDESMTGSTTNNSAGTQTSSAKVATMNQVCNWVNGM